MDVVSAIAKKLSHIPAFIILLIVIADVALNAIMLGAVPIGNMNAYELLMVAGIRISKG